MYIIHYPEYLDIQNYLGSLYSLCSKDSLDIHTSRRLLSGWYAKVIADTEALKVASAGLTLCVKAGQP
jgi:hypothetical protein